MRFGRVRIGSVSWAAVTLGVALLGTRAAEAQGTAQGALWTSPSRAWSVGFALSPVPEPEPIVGAPRPSASFESGRDTAGLVDLSLATMQAAVPYPTGAARRAEAAGSSRAIGNPLARGTRSFMMNVDLPSLSLGALGDAVVTGFAPVLRFDPPRSDGVIDVHADALYYDWPGRSVATYFAPGLGIALRPAGTWW